MHRFFIPNEWIHPSRVSLQGETARQIFRVLRLTTGETVICLDGSGNEYVVHLTQVEHERVEGTIIRAQPASGEPRTHLSLYISLTQRTKFEWILQKGTELGVSTFIPVITSRSLVRVNTGDTNKVARWENILREAAEQSGRGKIPILLPVMTLLKVLFDAKMSNTLCLIPWEKETRGDLKFNVSHIDQNKPATVAILIGPEGGFQDDEIVLAVENGWIPISLGARILRMETAALVATALVLHELGELKPPAGVATGF